jgi:hypothetical protein
MGQLVNKLTKDMVPYILSPEEGCFQAEPAA